MDMELPNNEERFEFNSPIIKNRKCIINKQNPLLNNKLEEKE